MSNPSDKDREFLGKIGEAIYKQQDYNSEDFSVSITKDQIRQSTGRTIVRDIVLEEYAKSIGQMSGVNASIQDDKIVVEAKSLQNQVFQKKYADINSLISSNNKIESEDD